MQRDDLLLRELVEETTLDAEEDVELGWEQADALRVMTLRMVNLSLAEQAGLRSQLAELTAQTDAFRLWVSDSDKSFLWVGDTFNDKERVAEESTVFVDTRGGTVTLHPTKARPMTQHLVAARIDPKLSVGGIPGNNLEIRSPGQETFTGQRPEPKPHLWRNRNPKSDRLANVFDGKATSWFEWERYKVHVPQRVIKAGTSMVADPSGKPYAKLMALGNWNVYIQWPGDHQTDHGPDRNGYPLAHFAQDHPANRKTKPKPKPGEAVPADLILAIDLSFDEPRPVSWIQLTPLVKGGTYPEVVQILVSSDGERWRKLLQTRTVLHPRMNRGIDFSDYGVTGSNFEGVGVWPMPGVPIQHVKIVLRQQEYYACEMGIGHAYTLRKRKKHWHRVKNRVQVVGSFQALPGDEADDPDDTDEITTKAKIREGFDIVNAERQVIAIRDLLLEERLYALTGQYVSKPFTLAKPIAAVALMATEQIPEDWEDADGDGDAWITYEVSADGHDWQPIVPQRTELDDSVVRFAQPTTSLYFRANLSRPDDSENESPILLAYGLKCLPA